MMIAMKRNQVLRRMKSLERNILKFIGFKPVRDTVFGMVEAVSDEKRKGWLKRVEDLGRQAI